MSLLKFTKEKLKILCRERHLDEKGTKQVLVQRLEENNETVVFVPPSLNIPLEHIWIASFDIGKNNFAFCIEETMVSGNRVRLGPLRDESYKKGMEDVMMNGKIIILENVSITQNCSSKKFDQQLLRNMNTVLESYRPYFEKCSHIVIEEQMSFGRNINVQALKLGQHCCSWFLIQQPHSHVHTFHAYHKTQVLCAPNKMTKPERKKWSVRETKRILEQRGDTISLEKINSVNKQDDLCDTLVQLQAFKILNFYL